MELQSINTEIETPFNDGWPEELVSPSPPAPNRIENYKNNMPEYSREIDINSPWEYWEKVTETLRVQNYKCWACGLRFHHNNITNPNSRGAPVRHHTHGNNKWFLVHKYCNSRLEALLNPIMFGHALIVDDPKFEWFRKLVLEDY